MSKFLQCGNDLWLQAAHIESFEFVTHPNGDKQLLIRMVSKSVFTFDGDVATALYKKLWAAFELGTEKTADKVRCL